MRLKNRGNSFHGVGRARANSFDNYSCIKPVLVFSNYAFVVEYTCNITPAQIYDNLYSKSACKFIERNADKGVCQLYNIR